MSSIGSVQLRTTFFQEDQFKAFQRDFQPRKPEQLRTWIYEPSPLVDYRQFIQAALANGEYMISEVGLGVDLWA